MPNPYFQWWRQNPGSFTGTSGAQAAGFQGPGPGPSPPAEGGLPGMPSLPPWEDDFFNPPVTNPNRTPDTPNISGVWDPVRWNITHGPGVGNIPFNYDSPLYPSPIRMPGLSGNLSTITDPYTGNPRLSIPGTYAPNIYPGLPPDETGSAPYPGSVAPLPSVEPIPTEFSPGPVMSMPFRPEDRQLGSMPMGFQDTLPPPAYMGPEETTAPYDLRFEGGPYPSPVPQGPPSTIAYGGSGPGLADFGGTPMDWGGDLPPSPDFTPSNYYLPQDYGQATVMTPSGVSAPAVPYDFSTGPPAGPYAPYDPGSVNMNVSDLGLPQDNIPTAPGVEPDVLPALQADYPGINTSDLVHALAQDQQDNRLVNQLRLPTDWAHAGQLFKDAAGNIVDATGKVIAAAGAAAQSVINNIMNNPGYSSPDYLRSIGYQPGQGRDSLWPGGPGSFGDTATGGASPGDFYQVANGPNIIPMTGGVGGAGGSFFGGQGNLAMSLPGSFAGLGAGGGGGSLGAWMFRRAPWSINVGGRYYNLNPAEHAWLAAGGVRSSGAPPGIFSGWFSPAKRIFSPTPGMAAPPVQSSLGSGPATGNLRSIHVPPTHTQ